MISAPKAFLIHGYLGAGKTTFAKRIEQEQGALRFSHDEWMGRLYGDDPPVEHFQDYSRRVSDVMQSLWTRCLECGSSIVLDLGFWSRDERERVGALVAKHGGEPILYRVDCPEGTAWERIVERNKQLAGSLYISQNTFEVLKARFEPLDPDEQRIEIDGTDSSWKRTGSSGGTGA